MAFLLRCFHWHWYKNALFFAFCSFVTYIIVGSSYDNRTWITLEKQGKLISNRKNLISYRFSMAFTEIPFHSGLYEYSCIARTTSQLPMSESCQRTQVAKIPLSTPAMEPAR